MNGHTFHVGIVTNHCGHQMDAMSDMRQTRGRAHWVMNVGVHRVRDCTVPLTRIDAPLLADNKQQELTSLTLETPLPTRTALIGYAGQCDAVGKSQG